MVRDVASGASPETMASAITIAVPLATLSASTDGRAPKTIASNQFAEWDATRILVAARNPMNASVTLVGKVLTVTSASCILAVSMAPARSHGNVTVTKAGEVSFAIKISTSAPTISLARMVQHASTPLPDLIPANVPRVSRAQTVKSSMTPAPPLHVVMAAPALTLAMISSYVSVLQAILGSTARSRVKPVWTDHVSMVPVPTHLRATSVSAGRDMRGLIVNVQ